MSASLGSSLSHAFHFISGEFIKQCAFIAYRYEGDVFRPETSESWVKLMVDGKMKTLHCWRTWVTGMWRSENGIVYVADAIFNQVIIYPGAKDVEKAYQKYPLEASMHGVWGYSDTDVWAWGTRAGTPVLCHWNGGEWVETATPGEILALHGSKSDVCYAVGVGGLIARWDGKSWETESSPTTHAITSVFVVDENEVWASTLKGELLQRKEGGWKIVLRHEPGIFCVAKWHGEVWIGANGAVGLSKVVKESLVSVKPKVAVLSIDVRHDLIAASREVLLSTTDGQTFEEVEVSRFVKTAEGLEPAWRL